MRRTDKFVISLSLDIGNVDWHAHSVPAVSRTWTKLRCKVVVSPSICLLGRRDERYGELVGKVVHMDLGLALRIPAIGLQCLHWTLWRG